MKPGLLTIILTLLAAALGGADARAQERLLNVSYDVSRAYYQEITEAFNAARKTAGKPAVQIDLSHGGSSKQARAVADGLEADVVTMNQETDIEFLVSKGLVDPDWRTRFPHRASPYTSTILFLVREGNPKGIRDWDDLVKPGVSVIIPNPKTSGNGRYSYLGAWAHVLRTDGDETAARAFVSKLFANVPVLDTGGRGATTTFAQRGIGDVLLTFENEIELIRADPALGGAKLEVVVPKASILADAPVAVVAPNVERRGTATLAREYLDFLFTPEGQEIAARHHFRPQQAAPGSPPFPALELVKVDEIFGGWGKANQVHFLDGGIFDQIQGAAK